MRTRRMVESKMFTEAGAVVFCVFFFQAEDGIRGADVTGVQTCALPIFQQVSSSSGFERLQHVSLVGMHAQEHDRRLRLRSEERRVGKECRARWEQDL